jgi:hypothetical protein
MLSFCNFVNPVRAGVGLFDIAARFVGSLLHRARLISLHPRFIEKIPTTIVGLFLNLSALDRSGLRLISRIYNSWNVPPSR